MYRICKLQDLGALSEGQSTMQSEGRIMGGERWIAPLPPETSKRKKRKKGKLKKRKAKQVVSVEFDRISHFVLFLQLYYIYRPIIDEPPIYLFKLRDKIDLWMQKLQNVGL